MHVRAVAAPVTAPATVGEAPQKYGVFRLSYDVNNVSRLGAAVWVQRQPSLPRTLS